MKPRIFKDIETQAKFDRDGYVLIDFISPEEAKIIAEKFYEFHDDLPKGFYSAAFSADEKYKQDIFVHTEKYFQNAVNEKFQDYKILGSTFLCKATGDDGKVGVHQDWTVTDESKYYSATVWVPTLDTTEENGALRVIPGSHLFFNDYRSNNIPVSYRGNESLLWENMITVPMRAGQAFILNHAVIHGSSPNHTNRERLAIAYGLVPKEADLIFYHKNVNEKSDRVEKFEMPDDFFQRYYNLGERPLFGNVVEEFEYPVPVVSRQKIKQLINDEKRKRGGFIEADNEVVIPEKHSLFNFARKIRESLFQ